MLEGRSKKAFKDWLGDRDQTWRRGIEVVAMDGFAGFKTATTEELPQAVSVMDPFHVVRLAGDALKRVPPPRPAGAARPPRPQGRPSLHRPPDPAHRRRPAHRPPARAPRIALRRRSAHSGRVHLGHLPAAHLSLPAPRPDRWSRRDELRDQRPRRRRAQGVGRATQARPHPGQTRLRRPAYFDRPRTSNGPTEAVNGRLEHLRGLALGFRNLTNYIARALLEAGGFRPQLHPEL